MKFMYVFPGRTVPPITDLLTADALSEQAAAAEAAGFSAVGLDEHPAPPQAWRETSTGHDSIDPFLALASVAAATSRIALCTYLAVLPYRNPFLFAKAVATLDVLSAGRVMLGLGAGYLEAEFEALGVSFAERNEIFDESLDVARRAWTGRPVRHEGRGFTARDVTVMPVPAQRPHPPLWFGGNSRRALRRVVEHGTGWMTLPASRPIGGCTEFSRRSPALEHVDDLSRLLGDLRAAAQEAGRRAPIEVMHAMRSVPRGPAEWLDTATALGALGVTWLCAGSSSTRLPEVLDDIAAFGRDVISPLAVLPKGPLIP